MSILRDVLRELLDMFLADVKLTGAILALVGSVALLIHDGLDPVIGGFGLLIGCLAILAIVASIESKRRTRSGP